MATKEWPGFLLEEYLFLFLMCHLKYPEEFNLMEPINLEFFPIGRKKAKLDETSKTSLRASFGKSVDSEQVIYIGQFNRNTANNELRMWFCD